MGRVGGRKKVINTPPPTTPEPQKPTPNSHPWLFILGHPRKPCLLSYYGGPPAEKSLKKSWDLLLEHLDPEQVRELVTRGQFTIRKRQTTVIVKADMSQVNVVGTTRATGRTTKYCTVSVVQVPLWDTILAQTLAVKYNWKYFKDKAIHM